ATTLWATRLRFPFLCGFFPSLRVFCLQTILLLRILTDVQIPSERARRLFHVCDAWAWPFLPHVLPLACPHFHCRNLLDCCAQRRNLVVRIMLIHFSCCVPGELLPHFHRHTSVSHDAGERMPERVKRERVHAAPLLA